VAKTRERGSAVVEVSLLAPWILFLFVGMFDMGMYTYSMMGVENAARVAAEYTSQNINVAADGTGACTRALAEMTMLPNVGAQANCNSGGSNTVVVSAQAVDSTTTPASVDGKSATLVQVTYTGNRLIPIPGLMMGQLNITRWVEVRVKP
jgi:Flp pilus assembly protein TadG